MQSPGPVAGPPLAAAVATTFAFGKVDRIAFDDVAAGVVAILVVF